MSAALQALEPRLLWERFAELTRIPRPSKIEEQARDHVLALAAVRGLEAAHDEVGNVVVRAPASAGREAAPAVVLQSHLDMVCERDPGSPFDPREGRIDVRVEDDWVRAEGTTLGADNGIGVATALAVLDDASIVHGPLELLFTVSEEQGLDGAKELAPSLVQGRLLVNLDGTSDEALTIGCAGSDHTLLHLDLGLMPVPPDHVVLDVRVSGGRGGHSGGDIAAGRANAIKTLGRLLAEAAANAPIRVAALAGGVSRNAIPREAAALVAVPSGTVETTRSVLQDECEAVRRQHAGTDDGIAVEVAAGGASRAADVETTRRTLDLLAAIPTGVIAMTPGRAGVVETSTSLTTATTEDGELVLGSMTRSSSAPALDGVLGVMQSLARLGHARIENRRSYPPWEPAYESRLLASAKTTYARVFGVDPALTVVHGGLECAVLGQRLPGVEMVSIGPEVVGPHAPGERVRISSVRRFYAFLTALLDDLSR